MTRIGSTFKRVLTTPLLLAAMVLYVPMVAQAGSNAVTFVVTKNDGIPQHIIHSTEQALIKTGIEIDKSIIEVNDFQTANAAVRASNPKDLIVSIGTKAAAFAYRQYPDRPMINALITHSSFAQLVDNHLGGAEQALNLEITPLLINQPISRFFTLGLQLVPEAKSIGVLIGPSNKAKLPDIKAQAERLGLTINIALLKPDSNPIKVIEPIMRSSDFFVVLPDRKYINQLAAKWILPLSYRYNKPVIAYSKKYVDAGALAAVFSSPDNVATRVAATVATTVTTTIAKQLQQDIPKATAGTDNNQYFSVALNRSVGRSLRIQLQQPEYYQQQLQAKEKSTP